MKKKDIVTLVISVAVFAGAGVFGYRMLFPSKQSNTEISKGFVVEESEKFTGEIDEETLNEVKTFQDYGQGDLENIGRINPFGPL